jgi:hypothetical protein
MKNSHETNRLEKKTLREILQSDNLCLSINPRGTDKGDKKSYIEKFYERHFAAYRDKNIELMEIGFRHGASLALWSKYFKKGSILGVDNFSDLAVGDDLPIVDEWINQPNIRLKIGDAYSKSFSEEISESFDIVIEDGLHTLETQKIALELYLPKLKPGGVFIVEDILSGGLAILPLLKKVPVGFNVYFYDFRWHRLSGDNCLFVVKHSNNKIITVVNRVAIIILGTLYVPTEGSLRWFKRFRKGNSVRPAAPRR